MSVKLNLSFSLCSQMYNIQNVRHANEQLSLLLFFQLMFYETLRYHFARALCRLAQLFLTSAVILQRNSEFVGGNSSSSENAISWFTVSNQIVKSLIVL